jgi:hypothetical protein
MNIESIKTVYDNESTFANVKSLLKRINNLLELKPVDYIHAHIYSERFEELCSKLNTKSIGELKIKLNMILGAIKRFDIDRCGAFRDKINALKTGEIILTHREEESRSWEELLKLFEQEIESNPNRFARIACVCFKHGYCLQINEIYGTTLRAGTPSSAPNHLNLETKVWTISDHKHSSKIGDRQFKVTQEFIDELLPHLEFLDYLLVYKKNMEPYKSNLLSSIGITGFTNNEVRNSYERWNWNDSGNTKAESMMRCVDILGHTVQTAERMFKHVPILLYTCDPHPLHIENPDKYGPGGKQKITAKLKSPV